MELSAVSFNIRWTDDPNGHSIAERAPRLLAIIAGYAPDLIGLQEYSPAWEPYIESALGKEYAILNRWRAETNGEGTPILYRKDRFDCLDNGCFWLSDTPEEESRGWDYFFNCYRICMYAVLRHKESGKCFTFMNTHFGGGDDCQIKSAKLLASYSKKISDLPTVITGDFNMTPSSVGYAEMAAHFIDVNAVTAKDTRATFHGYVPNEHLDEHIDYCFVTGDVTPLARCLLNETENGKYPSDHYGLYQKMII